MISQHLASSSMPRPEMAHGPPTGDMWQVLCRWQTPRCHEAAREANAFGSDGLNRMLTWHEQAKKGLSPAGEAKMHHDAWEMLACDQLHQVRGCDARGLPDGGPPFVVR